MGKGHRASGPSPQPGSSQNPTTVPGAPKHSRDPLPAPLSCLEDRGRAESSMLPIPARSFWGPAPFQEPPRVTSLEQNTPLSPSKGGRSRGTGQAATGSFPLSQTAARLTPTRLLMPPGMPLPHPPVHKPKFSFPS